MEGCMTFDLPSGCYPVYVAVAVSRKWEPHRDAHTNANKWI